MRPQIHRPRAAAIGCLAALGVFLTIGCSDPTPTEAQSDVPAANLVLSNGNLITVDPAYPAATSVAINGDRITAVGSDTDIAPYIGRDTEVIDLKGLTAIPGFIEGHGHYTSFGESLITLDFRHAGSFAAIVAMVTDTAASTRGGEWIIGRGWHQDKWRSRDLAGRGSAAA